MRALGATLTAALATSALVLALHQWYPARAFTFLYLPMVAVIAFIGGRAPGLLGSVVALAGAWFILLGPARAASVDTGLIIFGVTFAATTVGLSEAMTRLRSRALASAGLAAIVQSSDDAIFSKSMDATILTWNAGAEHMYGYTAVEAIGRSVEMLTPPDRAGEIPRIITRLGAGDRIEHYETARVKKDGTEIDVALTMSPIRDEFGRVVAASTIARDISERKRLERQQRFLVEAADLFVSSPSVDVLLQDLAGLLVPRLADWCSIDLLDEGDELRSVAMTHRDPAKVALAREILARTAADPRVQEARRRILETCQPELFTEIPDELLVDAVSDPEEVPILRALGLRSSVSVPLIARGRPIGVLSLVTAESGRRYGPDDLAFAEQLAQRLALAVDNARLHEAEMAARRTAEQIAGRIGRLQSFTAALSEALTPEQVGDLTLRQIMDELGAAAVALCLTEEEGRGLTTVAARGYSPELTERWWREPERVTPLVEAMRDARVVWYPSWTVFRTRYHEAEPPTDPVRHGARAAVPLLMHGRAIGGLYANFVDERGFTPDELEFMLAIGQQCAQAVERARLYAREHQVATTLQRALLPADLPQVPGLRLDAAYMAATHASDVGGDWYDVFRMPDGRVCVAIGDVVGHGLQAAVIMGQVRQAIRTAALESYEPAKVLGLANHVLALNRQEGMTTAVVGMFDPLSLTFTYAVAGHPAPIVADGENIVTLTSGGLPLGFLDGASVPTWTVQLARGALLVLYTDGLIEVDRDAAAGHDALVAAIRAERTDASPDPAHRILERVLAGAAPRDDIAIVAVALAPGPLDRLDVTLPAEPSSLRLVRQAMAQLSAGVGLDQRRAFDLNVAVGEAVNNAVEHAYGAASGTVRLRAYREDSVLRVEIEDAGRWRPDRPDNPGGRGFNLMRGLTDGVHVVTGERGTIVRLTIRLQQLHAAAAGTAESGAGPTAGLPADVRAEDRAAASLPAPFISVREDEPAPAPPRVVDGARIDVRMEGDVPVVVPTGDLDLSNVGQFLEILEEASAAARLVVVVLTHVSYLDSHGVRALLRARQRLAVTRGRLAVVAPAGSTVRRLVEVSGLGGALPLFNTLGEALASGHD